MKVEATEGDDEIGTCAHAGDNKANNRVGIHPTHGIPPGSSARLRETKKTIEDSKPSLDTVRRYMVMFDTSMFDTSIFDTA
jgi:hypothetical protein